MLCLVIKNFFVDCLGGCAGTSCDGTELNTTQKVAIPSTAVPKVATTHEAAKPKIATTQKAATPHAKINATRLPSSTNETSKEKSEIANPTVMIKRSLVSLLSTKVLPLSSILSSKAQGSSQTIDSESMTKSLTLKSPITSMPESLAISDGLHMNKTKLNSTKYANFTDSSGGTLLSSVNSNSQKTEASTLPVPSSASKPLFSELPELNGSRSTETVASTNFINISSPIGTTDKPIVLTIGLSLQSTALITLLDFAETATMSLKASSTKSMSASHSSKMLTSNGTSNLLVSTLESFELSSSESAYISTSHKSSSSAAEAMTVSRNLSVYISRVSSLSSSSIVTSINQSSFSTSTSQRSSLLSRSNTINSSTTTPSIFAMTTEIQSNSARISNFESKMHTSVKVTHIRSMPLSSVVSTTTSSTGKFSTSVYISTEATATTLGYPNILVTTRSVSNDNTASNFSTNAIYTTKYTSTKTSTNSSIILTTLKTNISSDVTSTRRDALYTSTTVRSKTVSLHKSSSSTAITVSRSLVETESVKSSNSYISTLKLSQTSVVLPIIEGKNSTTLLLLPSIAVEIPTTQSKFNSTSIRPLKSTFLAGFASYNKLIVPTLVPVTRRVEASKNINSYFKTTRSTFKSLKVTASMPISISKHNFNRISKSQSRNIHSLSRSDRANSTTDQTNSITAFNLRTSKNALNRSNTRNLRKSSQANRQNGTHFTKPSSSKQTFSNDEVMEISTGIPDIMIRTFDSLLTTQISLFQPFISDKSEFSLDSTTLTHSKGTSFKLINTLPSTTNDIFKSLKFEDYTTINFELENNSSSQLLQTSSNPNFKTEPIFQLSTNNLLLDFTIPLEQSTSKVIRETSIIVRTSRDKATSKTSSMRKSANRTFKTVISNFETSVKRIRLKLSNFAQNITEVKHVSISKVLKIIDPKSTREVSTINKLKSVRTSFSSLNSPSLDIVSKTQKTTTNFLSETFQCESQCTTKHKNVSHQSKFEYIVTELSTITQSHSLEITSKINQSDNKILKQHQLKTSRKRVTGSINLILMKTTDNSSSLFRSQAESTNFIMTSVTAKVTKQKCMTITSNVSMKYSTPRYTSFESRKYLKSSIFTTIPRIRSDQIFQEKVTDSSKSFKSSSTKQIISSFKISTALKHIHTKSLTKLRIESTAISKEKFISVVTTREKQNSLESKIRNYSSSQKATVRMSPLIFSKSKFSSNQILQVQSTSGHIEDRITLNKAKFVNKDKSTVLHLNFISSTTTKTNQIQSDSPSKLPSESSNELQQSSIPNRLETTVPAIPKHPKNKSLRSLIKDFNILHAKIHKTTNPNVFEQKIDVNSKFLDYLNLPTANINLKILNTTSSVPGKRKTEESFNQQYSLNFAKSIKSMNLNDSPGSNTSQPTLETFSCGCKLPSIENGQVKVENCVAYFTCTDGYTMLGTDLLYCMKDGRYNTLPPYCLG